MSKSADKGSSSSTGANKPAIIVEGENSCELDHVTDPNPIPLSSHKLRLNKSLACDVKPRQVSVSVLSDGSGNSNSSPALRPHHEEHRKCANGKVIVVPSKSEFEADALEAQSANSILKMKFNDSIDVDVKQRKPSTYDRT